MDNSDTISRKLYEELVKKHEALLNESTTQRQTLSTALTKLEGQNALLRESNFVLVNTYEAQIEKLKKKLEDHEIVLQYAHNELHQHLTKDAQESDDHSKLALYNQLMESRQQIIELQNKVSEYEITHTKNRADVVSYKNVIIELQDQIHKLSQQHNSQLLSEDLAMLVKLQLQIDQQSAAALAGVSLPDTSHNSNDDDSASVGGSPHLSNNVLITSIIAERDHLRVVKTRLEQDLSALRQQLTTLSDNIGSVNQSIPSPDTTAYKQQIEQLNNEIQSYKDKVSALSSELLLLHERLRNSTADISNVSQLHQQQQQSSSANPEIIIQLQTSLSQYQQQHLEDEKIIEQLEQQVQRLTKSFDDYKQAASSRLHQLTTKYKQMFDDASNLQRALIDQKQKNAKDIAQLHNQFITARTLSNRQRVQELSVMKEQIIQLRQEAHSIRAVTAGHTTDTSGITKQIVQQITRQNLQQTRILTFLKERYDQEVKLRKRVFNELQELKGNIRVYARLRPLNDRERQDKANHSVVTIPKEGEIRVLSESNGKKVSSSFEFEHVFDSLVTQDQVFDEVKDLIISVMDGYNVCIFAYGQTGSGKTYTMEGYGNAPGVNPRALELLFQHATSNEEWQWNVKLTLIEIYNEKVQDLLRENDANLNLRIVQGKDGMEIPGCNIVTVNSAEEVQQYLTRGKKNRHVTRTDMNEHSSRSHLILSVYVNGYNKLTGVRVNGRLNLIDLAGSERISRSGVTGEALKEAQKINYSLSALGNVIAARANKKDHVPYRDSALTYLLQDSLDKNSKTLMIVQLSPTLESAPETLCSLRFAERVRKVELGKASRNQQTSQQGTPDDDY